MTTPTNNEDLPGNDSARRYDETEDLAEIGVGWLLTIISPTLLYCATIGQLWPFWLLAVEIVLGTVVGYLMFRLRSDRTAPVIDLNKPPRVAHVQELRKAA